MGILEGIAYKVKEDEPMQLIEKTRVSCEGGIENDYLGKPGPRQVIVLSVEGWQAACQELGIELPWYTRRANLLISGVPLADTKGQRLTIGQMVLEITGQTRPCDLMDRMQLGLKKALTPQWRGGITCRVLESGVIQLHDPVSISNS